VVECQLPKLDVAGSTPVSRSIFSITYSVIADRNLKENGVTSFLGRLELIVLSGLTLMRMPAYPLALLASISLCFPPLDQQPEISAGLRLPSRSAYSARTKTA
jgi:hypothetical protein